MLSDTSLGKRGELKLGLPQMVIWYATEKCDVGCRHCCYSPKGARELGTDEAKALISELSRDGVKHFTFVGGEPLLRDDVVELCKFCNEVGLRPYAVTKGGRLVGRGEESEELAKELRRAGVKVTVAVDGIIHATIDAMREAPEVYERSRRGSSSSGGSEIDK